MADKNRPPMWAWLDNGDINEGLRAGSVVGRLYAHDPDGDNIRFKLVENEDNAFKIVGDKLVTTRALDYEFKSEYAIKIRAIDSHGAYDDMHSIYWTIDVNNINDANDFGDRINAGWDQARVIGTKHSEEISDNFGNSVIKGKGGHDVFHMWAGNDSYVGGSGADEFQFSADAGREVIRDFQARGYYHDEIIMSFGDKDWDWVMDNKVHQVGDNVVIEGYWGSYSHSKSQLTLLDIDKDDLTRANFHDYQN